jgi:hypothetical protein
VFTNPEFRGPWGERQSADKIRFENTNNKAMAKSRTLIGSPTTLSEYQSNLNLKYREAEKRKMEQVLYKK